jgi:hypothetical protein
MEKSGRELNVGTENEILQVIIFSIVCNGNPGSGCYSSSVFPTSGQQA